MSLFVYKRDYGFYIMHYQAVAYFHCQVVTMPAYWPVGAVVRYQP